MITILDDDCLLYIFKYLSMKDIMNIERAHPDIFKEASQMYYRKIKHWEFNYRYTNFEDLEPILSNIGPSITSFKFSGGYIMKDDFKETLINLIVLHCDKLLKLSLNYMPLEENDLVKLECVIINLVELDLGNCHVSDELLEGPLTKAEQLRKLKLNGNSALKGFCIVKLKLLIVLDVSYCFALSKEYFCQFLINCAKLKTLNLSGCYMINWTEVFDALCKNQPELEELYILDLGIEQNELLCHGLKNLKKLDFTGRRLGQ